MSEDTKPEKSKNDLVKLIITGVLSALLGTGGGGFTAYQMNKKDVQEIAQDKINDMLVIYNARLSVVENDVRDLKHSGEINNVAVISTKVDQLKEVFAELKNQIKK